MKRILIIFAAAVLASFCASAQRLSRSEKNLICGSPDLMRVLTIDNYEDSLLLRKESRDFRAKDLRSEAFKELSRKMIVTVQDPDNTGVGIAGPQVGVLRRVVAVQRFDKVGRPFEVYPNVRIVRTEGELYPSPEGCLSVPGRSGKAQRYHYITITYTDPETLETTRENIQGYTAIIFQHEVDHLDGVLYIDRLCK